MSDSLTWPRRQSVGSIEVDKVANLIILGSGVECHDLFIKDDFAVIEAFARHRTGCCLPCFTPCCAEGFTIHQYALMVLRIITLRPSRPKYSPKIVTSSNIMSLEVRFCDESSMHSLHVSVHALHISMHMSTWL
jgi:hypothetical protein